MQRLRHAIGREQIVVGDLVMLKILQRATSEYQAITTERLLRDFSVVYLLDDALAVQAARHYRCLRAFGGTVRKIIDIGDRHLLS
jgi:hypothetical protein